MDKYVNNYINISSHTTVQEINNSAVQRVQKELLEKVIGAIFSLKYTVILGFGVFLTTCF